MRNVFGWSIVLSGCLVGVALSQNAAQERREAAQPRPGGAAAQPERGERTPGAAGERRVPGAIGERAAAGSADQQIAACVYIGCRNHIAFAEFAQSKLTNPEARQFAEKMVSDHSPGCSKMRELAGNLVMGRAWDAEEGAVPRRTTPGTRDDRPGAREGAPATPRRPDGAEREGGGGQDAQDPAGRREERQERREERREAVRDAAGRGVEVEVQPGAQPGVAVRAGGAAAGHLDWVMIHKEIADQCLSTLKKEFSELEGAEFDKAYMAHEVMIHLKTIDELTILKKHASPTLRTELDKSIQLAQTHLREAKQIMDQLKGGEGEPRLSRQPGKTTTPATRPPAVPRKEE